MLQMLYEQAGNLRFTLFYYLLLLTGRIKDLLLMWLFMSAHCWLS